MPVSASSDNPVRIQLPPPSGKRKVQELRKRHGVNGEKDAKEELETQKVKLQTLRDNGPDMTASGVRNAAASMGIERQVSEMQKNTVELRNCDKVLKAGDQNALPMQFNCDLTSNEVANKGYDASKNNTDCAYGGWKRNCLGREENARGKVVCVAASKSHSAKYIDQRQDGTGLAGANADKEKNYAVTIPAIAKVCGWLTCDADGFEVEGAANCGNFDKLCDIVSKKKKKTKAQRAARRDSVNRSFCAKGVKLRFKLYRFDEQGVFEPGDQSIAMQDERRRNAGYRFKILPGYPRFDIEE